MLIDLRQDPAAASAAESDVCVIGAGAAGLTLARRLAEQGRSVTLLESGGLDFEQDTQDLYRGANVGMPYYDLDQSRLRFFGGTVAIWGGRCALLDPIDFQRREWVAHSGWPIARENLLPFYTQAHAMLELGAFNYDQDVWAALGVTDPNFDPARIDVALWRFDEVRERFAASRARDLFDLPKLRILLHANAVKLQADSQGRRIEQVEVRSLGGPLLKVRARRYIVACGTIENSRLLLASNDVEPDGIGNTHDQVGRFFMEHPAGRIAKIETAEPFELWSVFRKRFRRDGPPLAPALRLADETQAREQALNGIVTMKLQRDPRHGVALGNKLYNRIKHSVDPTRSGRALDHIYRGVRAWLHANVRETVARARAKAGMTSVYLITRGEQAPNPESRVLLSDERDALGNRRANLAWRLSEIDKHSQRVLVRTFDAELRRLGKGSATPSEWLADSDPQWPIDLTVGNHPLANYHQMGGTRMSDDPRHGVVDSNCRVHGYDNLYMAGSSVFPTGGWANPTLTIIALSLRLADHLDATAD
ncbi:MAG: GMC family oxidoreductase [Pseudomonadota bacterium]|nr:GMC family oxidoreductase [Sphingomonas sp.]MDQ3478712.1 GMC family oxidoreductase [Pseudomonadota bacterium]